MNKEIRERIDEFLRGDNRGKEFTIEEISLGVNSSQKEVRAVVEEVVRREKICQGGASIIKGRELDHYCCRAKHLDKLSAEGAEPEEISSLRRLIYETF